MGIFVPFIFVSTFIIVNLIIAIVVDAMNDMNATDEAEQLQEKQHHTDALQEEVINLRKDIQALKVLLEKNN